MDTLQQAGKCSREEKNAEGSLMDGIRRDVTVLPVGSRVMVVTRKLMSEMYTKYHS